MRAADAVGKRGGQGHGGVDEIPAFFDFDECRMFAVFVCLAVFAETGGKADAGMAFAGGGLMFPHLQSLPFGGFAPFADGGGVEQRLLGGDGAGDEVIDIAQNVGRVTRTHQGFGIGGGRTLVQCLAALGIGPAGLAGAVHIVCFAEMMWRFPSSGCRFGWKLCLSDGKRSAV